MDEHGIDFERLLAASPNTSGLCVSEAELCRHASSLSTFNGGKNIGGDPSRTTLSASQDDFGGHAFELAPMMLKDGYFQDDHMDYSNQQTVLIEDLFCDNRLRTTFPLEMPARETDAQEVVQKAKRARLANLFDERTILSRTEMFLPHASDEAVPSGITNGKAKKTKMMTLKEAMAMIEVPVLLGKGSRSLSYNRRAFGRAFNHAVRH